MHFLVPVPLYGVRNIFIKSNKTLIWKHDRNSPKSLASTRTVKNGLLLNLQARKSYSIFILATLLPAALTRLAICVTIMSVSSRWVMP